MKAIVAALVVILAAPGVGHAQGLGVAQACNVRALCAGVAPGQGRMMVCLKAHESELSDACLATLGRVLLARVKTAPHGPSPAASPGGPAPVAAPGGDDPAQK
jgi:hypothetical protein